MDRPVLSKYERASTLGQDAANLQWFQTRLEQQPDETLAELQRELQKVSSRSSWRVLPDNTTQVFRLSEMVISDSAAAPVPK
jgi:hypothetical protein